MRILSIQSSVAFGHVGNSAAVFPLQRLGHEVIAVNTVHFSNHTGYGAWRGPLISPDDVREVILGIEERGVFPQIDVVLSGYQGSPGVADVVLTTVARVRSLNPNAVYCADPVMGDVGRGMFVLPGVPELIRERVMPVADVLTPNAFELSYLAFGGDPSSVDPDRVASLDELLSAVDTVRAMGPRTVLVTSVQGSVVESGQIGMVAVDDSGAYLVRTPELPLSVNGAGDVTAALFLAHLGDGIATALARVASSVYGILAATHTAGSREIALIAAQDVVADPPAEFPVEQVR